VLVLIPPGDLGKKVDQYWGVLKGYARRKLGDRLFMASKRDKNLEGGGHRFSSGSFDGNMKSKGFKFSQRGISIVGYGESNPFLKIPEPRICLESDVAELKAHVGKKARILGCGLGKDLMIPSMKYAMRRAARRVRLRRAGRIFQPWKWRRSRGK